MIKLSPFRILFIFPFHLIVKWSTNVHQFLAETPPLPSKILTVSRYSIKNRPNLKRALAKQLHRQQRFVYLLTGEISFTTLESTGDEGGIGRERGRKKNFIGLRTTNDCLTRYIKKISIFIINFIVDYLKYTAIRSRDDRCDNRST